MSWEALLSALAVGIPSLTLGILAYRRSRAVDASSAKTGVASDLRAETAQIIAGLGTLVDQLQEDNAAFRDELRGLAVRLESCMTEREVQKKELARLHKKYGNGE